MRRIALAVAVAAAVLLTCAVGSALAAPEFFSGGEPVPPKPKIAFTSKGVSSKWETGFVMECNNSSAKGDVEAQALVKMRITYEKCTAPSLFSSCQKASSKPGVIETELLTAPLAEASELKGGALSTVVDIQAEKEEKPIAAFHCGPKEELSVILSGELLAEIEPVGKPEATTGFVIAQEKASEPVLGCTKQQFLYLNGLEPCRHVEAGNGGWWFVTHETLTYKAPIEIHP
jgi:hypothetical protein